MTKRLLLLIFIFLQFAHSQPTFDATVKKVADRVWQMEQWRAGRWQLYTENGQWKYRKSVNWLSGFLGGELWNMYRLTGDERFKKSALHFAGSLIPYAQKNDTHDMGFIFLPTVVRAFKITGNQKFKKAGLLAAEMLWRRYNRKGHFIRAWGKLGTSKKAGWSIIDTMMNLELLFWASKVSGNPRFAEAAYAHAITCMKQHIRPNGSSFHVVIFDPQTGKVLKKQTHQGAADTSTWARGQAWGIYGFATAYRYTRDERFLRTAQRMADFMIALLPKDGIPFWDLTNPAGRNYRDASAGAVLAVGLYRLASLVHNGSLMLRYQQVADEIMASLIDRYTFWHSSRPVEQGLLIHQVYNYPKGWAVDESYPAGDYYFTEALLTYRQRKHWLKPEAIRQKINLDADWLYLPKDVTELSDLSAFTGDWQRVDLPHTWNRFDAMDGEPGYRRSGSWYKKRLFIPPSLKNKQLWLYFEDANTRCKVWVNGRLVGNHVGGYLGFRMDITPAVALGKENDILVYVSNAYDPDLIPSQKSDFFIYGGLTRDVWLEVLPQIFIEKILISTPEVSLHSAATQVKMRVSSPQRQKAKFFVQVLDDQKNVCLQTVKTSALQTGSNEIFVNLPELKNPQLWSPNAPHLYKLKAELKTGNQIVDFVSEKFGYRWFEFKKHGPFYLNGKRLLLRGTHRHEEEAGYGAAMPNDLHRRDMEAIKKMGANFVRLAHYPQDPEVYWACDSLGLLVWDELPWCRGGMGGKTWKENTKRLLKEQILQNFNHPSIIIWSLGNELNWLPDFPNGGNDDSLKAMLRTLNKIAHQLDPSRVTAVRKYKGAVGIVDVFSPSIWAGWYSGVYKNYRKALEKSREEYPRFFHAEYGGASHFGRHDEQVITGEGKIEKSGWEEDEVQTAVKNIARTSDWSENYIVDLFDWHLHVSEQLPWFTGSAQWIFKDFGTPLRPENPIPYVNEKGLMDRAGRPKDAYYVFKSYWNTDDPFCYIESHTWTERYGPKGKARQVCVYSNCGQVELKWNGKSLGMRKKDIRKFPAENLHWQVPFVEGENRLIALGFKNGKRVACDTLLIHYRFSRPKPPVKLKVNARKVGAALFRITVLAVDAKGRRSLNYNKRVYFSALQGGKLQENLGTPDGSSIIEMSNGKAQILFRKYPDQKAVVEVRNQDFKGSYLILDAWQ